MICEFAYDWYTKDNKMAGDVVPSACKSTKAIPHTPYSVADNYNSEYPYIGQSASILP